MNGRGEKLKLLEGGVAQQQGNFATLQLCNFYQMNSDMSRKPETTDVLKKWLPQVGVYILIIAVSLFATSGRLDWGMAWVYIGVYVAVQVVFALIMLPHNPELIVDRTQNEGPRDLDRILAGIMALFGPVSIWIVAGLDMRFGWSAQMPLTWQLVALAVVAVGSLLTIWAMAVNKFFYGTVRIDKEKNHMVVSNGPYQYIRHPGYTGAIIFDLATSLALGSLWAFIPALLTTGFIIIRTALEDKTLQEELPGYKTYAQRVHYRLLPGMW